MTTEQYESNPRDYALEMIEREIVSNDCMLLACLKYMSAEDVRSMLDANELSPRFKDLL